MTARLRQLREGAGQSRVAGSYSRLCRAIVTGDAANSELRQERAEFKRYVKWGATVRAVRRAPDRSGRVQRCWPREGQCSHWIDLRSLSTRMAWGHRAL